MAKPERRHVVPDPTGGWNVRKPGSGRVSSHHQRQSDAEAQAKRTVQNLGGGEVRIHGRNGQVRDSDTVRPARDPNPPRDRRH